MNILGTLCLVGGGILVYGAVKNQTPAEVIKGIMSNNGKSVGASGSVGATANTGSSGGVGGSVGVSNLIPPAQKFVSP